MNDVIRENSANSVESSESCRQLNGQVSQLETLISRFKFD